MTRSHTELAAIETLERRTLLSAALLAEIDGPPGAGAWADAWPIGVHRIYGGVVEGTIDSGDDVDLYRFQPFAGSMGDAFGARLIAEGDLHLHVKVFSSPDELLYDYGPATADVPLAVPFSLLDGNYYVEVSSEAGTSGAYRLEISAGLGVYDFDKSHFGATDAGVYTGQPLSAGSFIEYQGDIDVHKFMTPQAGPVMVHAAADTGHTLDPVLRIFRVDDGQEVDLGWNDNAASGTTDAEVVFDAPAGVPIYVEVRDAAGTGIGDYTVTISAAPVENSPPVIGRLAASAPTITQGEPLVLTADMITDADGDAIQRVMFEFNGQQHLATHVGGGQWQLEVNAAVFPSGVQTVRASAWDGEHWSEWVEMQITVEPGPTDSAHLYLSVTVPPASQDVDRGDTATITWDDPDAANTRLLLYADPDGGATPWVDGAPSVLLASIDGADAVNSFAWDTSGIAAGTWTIYARLYSSDPDHPETPIESLYQRAADTITVRHDGSLVRGDLDGDGTSDLLLQDTDTGEARIWLMDRTQRRAAVTLPALADNRWRIVDTADLDGDGDTDLLWQHADTNRLSVWRMDGLQIEGFRGLAYCPNADWKVTAIGDFDGDGNSDLVWSNGVNGLQSIWFMNGTAVKGFKGFSQVTSGFQIRAAADFDGDGQTDLLWQKNDALVVWRMQGTAVSGFTRLPQVAATEVVCAVSDLDGNGALDLVLGSAGESRIWLMRQLGQPLTLHGLPDLPGDDWHICA